MTDSRDADLVREDHLFYERQHAPAHGAAWEVDYLDTDEKELTLWSQPSAHLRKSRLDQSLGNARESNSRHCQTSEWRRLWRQE